LIKAVASYRSRGYGIAISHFGRRQLDFAILRELRPDIVKLDSLLLSSARPLQRIIEALRKLPAQVLIEGIDTAAMRKGAQAGNIDLLQAHAPVRRLLHSIPTTSASNAIRIRSAA
jgi:EAL domain-containing protein (putative c-di-GMP-specific phosphodiesterase class I)